MLIVVVITLSIVGVFLFFGYFFTIYTEHHDFYVTFNCTTKANKPARQVSIKYVDFMNDKNVYQTDSTGKTKPILIRSEAVKNLFTRKRPSIFYFNPLFQFPDVDSNFYRIKFFDEKKSHSFVMYKQHQDIVMDRGLRIQSINLSAIENNTQTAITKIFINKIIIEGDAISIDLVLPIE
ncbi:MAG: hypothetical protein MUF68_03795 [Cyclobacteriaceae bacterium]|nr:hypothetical protein [Cyclobacteriaceae bacterium]